MPPQQNFVAERGTPITVVLVDDEQLIRAALAQALSSGGLDLVGEAANADDGIEVVLNLRPDVVLMDLRLPGISGVQAIERLSLLAPASRVLVLTRTEQNRVVEAIVAGATGYILKTAPPAAIIAAVRATAAGESVISSEIAGKLLERIRQRDIPVTATSRDAGDAIRAALTQRSLGDAAASGLTGSLSLPHPGSRSSSTSCAAGGRMVSLSARRSLDSMQ